MLCCRRNWSTSCCSAATNLSLCCRRNWSTSCSSVATTCSVSGTGPLYLFSLPLIPRDGGEMRRPKNLLGGEERRKDRPSLCWGREKRTDLSTSQRLLPDREEKDSLVQFSRSPDRKLSPEKNFLCQQSCLLYTSDAADE